MRIAEEIFKELIEKFRKGILINGNPNHIDQHAKECAAICCDEIINVLEKLRKPEYATFIEWEQLKTKEEADTWDGYEYTDYWLLVKQQKEII